MSQQPRSKRALALLPQLSLVLLAVALCIQQIRSYDYWWHLRTGRLILETRAVPYVDPYSYTAPGSPWIDVHWLFQIGLYAVHWLGGHTGVILAQLVLVLLLVGCVRQAAGHRERAALGAAALTTMLVVVIYRVMPRPELPSFVLLAALLALFDRFERKGDAWIYAVVPIQLIWANFHGLFAVGLGVCGLFLAAELLRPWSPAGGALRAARVRRLAAVTALAALACLFNPNTALLPLYALKQLGMIGADRHPGLASVEIWSLISAWPKLTSLYLAAFLALAVTSLAAMIANWRQARVADPLLWLTFLGLAVAGHRNVALFAIVATPILVRNAAEWLDRSRPLPRLRPLAAVLVSALIWLVAVDAQWGRFFERLGIPRGAGFGIVEVMAPVAAAEWISANRPPGPISHHMSDGGYLIWRLYPTYPVMIDGRLEVYGGEKNVRLWVESPEKFRELDRSYRFGTVIVRFSEYLQGNLLGALYDDPGWKLVFSDDVAAVFVRNTDAEGFPEVDVGDPNLFPPLRGEPPSVHAFRIQGRARFYAAVGRRDLEERVLREDRRR
jgi:hypothetical protein